MKVGSSSGPAGPTAGPAKPAAAPGFSAQLSGAGVPASAAVSGAAPVSSLEALVALQQEEGPLERRRRAVVRAGAVLDLLDEVKLALLDGGATAPALERLARAVRSERARTDDPRLEEVLDEIETRAAVEMAKLDAARAAA